LAPWATGVGHKILTQTVQGTCHCTRHYPDTLLQRSVFWAL
jgi:hypothetical protein